MHEFWHYSNVLEMVVVLDAEAPYLQEIATHVDHAAHDGDSLGQPNVPTADSAWGVGFKLSWNGKGKENTGSVSQAINDCSR